MELPRKILIGDDVICQLGSFIMNLDGNASKIAIITGSNVKAKMEKTFRSSIFESSLQYSWHIVHDASMDSVNMIHRKFREHVPDFVIGFGGGRSVDIAKMTAFKMDRPFISVPTSASHDGISSPFVSIRGIDKPYSIKAKTPIGVAADTHLMLQAPRRLLAGGCGDLVAKITAVKDWELARDEKGEYFGSYAANLACMSAKIILKESKKLNHKSH